jgi:nucleoside-diphosphate-sugar epimerase
MILVTGGSGFIGSHTVRAPAGYIGWLRAGNER